MRSAEPKVKPASTAGALPPQTLRRRVKASASVLVMQEAAAQVRNEANAALLAAHYARSKLPSKIELKKTLKHAPSAIAMGRAKQVQYAIDDAAAMVAAFRSNFFDWVKDHSLRPGQPRPPRFYRRGQRARLRFDYQDFSVVHDRLHLPESLGLGVIALVDRVAAELESVTRKLDEQRRRTRMWFGLVVATTGAFT